MRLDEAANVVAAVNTAHTREQETLLYEFLVKHKDSLVEFCSLLYGPAILKPEHIMSAIHRSYGIFPEEFELVEGAPLVPSLASESPDECDVSMSIPEALSTVSSIRGGVDILTVIRRMDKLSAEAVWCRALGDRPVLPRKRLLRAIAHGGGKYSPERLTSALSVENMPTVLKRAIEGKLSETFRIEAGHPFKAPSFAPWRYWSLPFTHTYYDVVTAPRRYAHQVSGVIFVYDSQGEMELNSVSRAPANIPLGGDCIALIDEHGEVLEWLYTESEPDLWNEPYEERAVNILKVKDATHMRQLCESLKEGEVLRLIDGDRGHIHNQHKGGFILPRRIYELPLLITQAKTKSDGEWVSLRIEAMDGFDPIHVGYSNIEKKRVPDNPVMREGCRRQVWTELEPPLVGSFHALRCRDGKIEGAYLISLATEKGMSDVMQYTDVMEIDGHGQAR